MVGTDGDAFASLWQCTHDDIDKLIVAKAGSAIGMPETEVAATVAVNQQRGILLRRQKSNHDCTFVDKEGASRTGSALHDLAACRPGSHLEFENLVVRQAGLALAMPDPECTIGLQLYQQHVVGRPGGCRPQQAQAEDDAPGRFQVFFHLIEQPMLGICSAGP